MCGRSAPVRHDCDSGCSHCLEACSSHRATFAAKTTNVAVDDNTMRHIANLQTHRHGKVPDQLRRDNSNDTVAHQLLCVSHTCQHAHRRSRNMDNGMSAGTATLPARRACVVATSDGIRARPTHDHRQDRQPVSRNNLCMQTTRQHRTVLSIPTRHGVCAANLSVWALRQRCCVTNRRHTRTRGTMHDARCVTRPYLWTTTWTFNHTHEI